MTATAVRPDPTAARDAIVRHRWSVDDYYRLAEAGVFKEDSRIELVEGEVVDMAPIGSLHAYTLDRLARLLYRKQDNPYLIRIQNPIHLDDHNEPQPDLVVARDHDYSAGHPQAADILLVVEVADTTLVYDRDVKLPLYARHGIPQCWLLDVKAGTLTVFNDPVDGRYRQAASIRDMEGAEIGDIALAAADLSGLLDNPAG